MRRYKLITTILLLLILSSLVANSQFHEKYDFIIITSDKFSQEFKPLVNHKESYGIKTKVIKLNDIYDSSYFPSYGRDNPEKIKYFIKDAIQEWGISYVMFVGNSIPVRFVESTFGPPFISDLYFADVFHQNGSFCDWDTNKNNKFGEISYNDSIIDKVDLIQDVYIGRLLCQSSDEITRIIDKIIYYENNTKNQSWFQNLVVCGGDTKPLIHDILYRHLFLKGEGEVAFEGELISERIIHCMTNFTPIKLFASNYDLSSSAINKYINKGAGFILFSGHGTYNRWGTYQPFFSMFGVPFPFGYTINDVKNLENENKNPVVVFSSCLCGDFSYCKKPISWEILNFKENGAIASFACTAEIPSLPGSLCMETLNGYITVEIFESYANGEKTVGKILSNVIDTYLNDSTAMSDYLGLHSNYECLEKWLLFGDPTLKIGGYLK